MPFDWYDAYIEERHIWFGRSEMGGERDVLLVPCVLTSLPSQTAFLWSTTNGATDRADPWVVDAMVELNLIDTQGGGINRMFETQRRRSFPLPDYDLSDPGQVSVGVAGRILDERYTRLLMERTDLDLGQVMLLDRVQKGRRIGREDHRRLKSAGLVEGRYPNLIVAAAVAKAASEAGRHIRERGFDKQYYLDLILALVREHGPVERRDVDAALISKLPDRLTAEQKRLKVRNLLQQLRREGRIINTGSRSRPRWSLGEGQ